MGLFKKKKPENKLNEYFEGYSKQNQNLATKITSLFGGYSAIDDDLLEELLVVLIEADVGVTTSEKIIERLKTKIRDEMINRKDEAIEALVSVMRQIYEEKPEKPFEIKDGLNLIMMVGVNGSGKTTSISKLARYYGNKGYKVGLIAADTFRAGAIEQLKKWAERLGIDCYAGKEGADPASVMVDGCRFFKEKGVDLIIADTAGRLQNKKNLMQELNKMKRVTARELGTDEFEIWLTIDATTGQNGLSQASVFIEATDVTGVILTKMDGTSKGGIVLAIKDQYNLPVRFITYGEGIEDLTEFYLKGYLETVIEEADA